MKLRFSKNFGKRAGTCWRLIFVYALMPWLHKYRIMAREDETALLDQKRGDLEQRYPSLKFISLRAMNMATNCSEKKEFGRTGRVKGSMADKDERVRELEEEVQRLTNELSQASSSLVPPFVVTASLADLEPVVPPAPETSDFVPSQSLPPTSKDMTV
jgi:hypothetical protein